MRLAANDLNVVLISLDTLRPDHLGCYGYRRDTSPNIDRLAQEGARFDSFFANAGWTMPQHFTLLTGMYPLTHDMIRIQRNRPLSPRLTLLAQLLKRHGYRTQGFLSQNKFVDPRHGFDRGFDGYQWGPGRTRHTPLQSEQVIGWLRTHGKAGKFFLYIHNDECHEPFDPPAEFDCFGDGYGDKYDGAIRYLDHYLGQWVDTLEALGLAERTIVFVTSDHGTEFRDEHGYDGKSASLYNQVVRCLLIVWGPRRIPAGRVVTGLTETAQIPATILDLLGLPQKADAQGRSCAPCLFTDAAGLPHVCSYTRRNGNLQVTAYEHYAIRTDHEKLVRLRLAAPFNPLFFHRNWLVRLRGLVRRLGLHPSALRRGGVIREFYRLSADPGETHNIYGQAAARAAELEWMLDDWLARSEAARREWTHSKPPQGRVTFMDTFESSLNWTVKRGNWQASGGRLIGDAAAEPCVAMLRQNLAPRIRTDIELSADDALRSLFFVLDYKDQTRFRYLGVRADRQSWVAGVCDGDWRDRMERPEEDLDLTRPLRLTLVRQAGGWRLFAHDRLVLRDEDGAAEPARLGLAADAGRATVRSLRLSKWEAR